MPDNEHGDINWPQLLLTFVPRAEFTLLQEGQKRMEAKLDGVLAARVPAWLLAFIGPVIAIVVSYYLPQHGH